MPPKRRTSPARLRQSTLNFGQKSPAAAADSVIAAGSAQCAQCGMLLNAACNEDTLLHAKYHREREAILKYSTPQNSGGNGGERIVQEYADGKCVVIDGGAKSTQKVLRLLEFVDEQLGIGVGDGITAGIDDDDVKIRCRRRRAAHAETSRATKFYLFVSQLASGGGGRVVGFCMAESIERAHTAEYVTTRSSSSCALQRRQLTVDEARFVPALCGINRIWVSTEMRGKRIGTRLLDCVRLNFLYFRPLDTTQIAFSDPTEAGQRLAHAYCQTDRFLVYSTAESHEPA